MESDQTPPPTLVPHPEPGAFPPPQQPAWPPAQQQPAWPPQQQQWPPQPAWPGMPPQGPWGHPPGGPLIPPWNLPPPAGSGRFRPQTVPELVDAAFSLYRRNLLLLIGITAVVQIPFTMITSLVSAITHVGSRVGQISVTLTEIRDSSGSTVTSNQHDALVSGVGALAVYVLLTLVVGLLVVQPLTTAALASAVSARYLDRPATVEGSLAIALRRLGALALVVAAEVVIAIAASAAVVALFIFLAESLGPTSILLDIILLCALGLGLVVIVVRWVLAAQIVVIERCGAGRALARSWRLTRGSVWRTIGLLLVLGLLTTIVSRIVQSLVLAPFGGIGPDTQQTVTDIVDGLVNVVLRPITLVTLTLYYYDRRIRAEAFDIEMLAAHL